VIKEPRDAALGCSVREGEELYLSLSLTLSLSIDIYTYIYRERESCKNKK
jgi:hypothetical protein